jgi:acyl-CoA thioester hydrolase
MKHTFNLRVYYEDTDAGGIVYHANYLKFAERARTEFLNELGLSNSDMMKQDTAFVVSRIEIDYKRPALLEEKLSVETTIEKLGAATLILNQNVMRQDELLAALKVSVVVVSMSEKKAIRIPEKIRLTFDNF